MCSASGAVSWTKRTNRPRLMKPARYRSVTGRSRGPRQRRMNGPIGMANLRSESPELELHLPIFFGWNSYPGGRRCQRPRTQARAIQGLVDRESSAQVTDAVVIVEHDR